MPIINWIINYISILSETKNTLNQFNSLLSADECKLSIKPVDRHKVPKDDYKSEQN